VQDTSTEQVVAEFKECKEHTEHVVEFKEFKDFKEHTEHVVECMEFKEFKEYVAEFKAFKEFKEHQALPSTPWVTLPRPRQA